MAGAGAAAPACSQGRGMAVICNDSKGVKKSRVRAGSQLLPLLLLQRHGLLCLPGLLLLQTQVQAGGCGQRGCVHQQLFAAPQAAQRQRPTPQVVAAGRGRLLPAQIQIQPQRLL